MTRALVPARAAKFLSAVVLLLAICFSAVAAMADSEKDKDDDHLVLSFSTVGDSRQDPKKPDPTTTPVPEQDKIWLQNTKALSRIVRSVQDQKSNFLFFNGDMIMGYGAAVVPADATSVTSIVNSDLVQFYRQYGFWRGIVAPLMESGTYVFPVAGNHEVQCNSSNTKQCAKSGKNAMVENENAWRANMGDLIVDDARFQRLFGTVPSFEDVNDNGALDSLSSNQKQLSYSFDYKGVHFAIINTDPVGNDAHAPVNWLAQDFANARARGAKNFFVFGHKPAFTYYYGSNNSLPTSPSGLDQPTSLPARDDFWNLIADYGAVYFCGHEHIFNLSHHTAKNGKSAWQVLVGSGGSPFEAAPTDVTINPQTDRDYAWATVKVYEDGSVKIKAYGFNDQFGPTEVIGSVKLK